MFPSSAGKTKTPNFPFQEWNVSQRCASNEIHKLGEMIGLSNSFLNIASVILHHNDESFCQVYLKLHTSRCDASSCTLRCLCFHRREVNKQWIRGRAAPRKNARCTVRRKSNRVKGVISLLETSGERGEESERERLRRKTESIRVRTESRCVKKQTVRSKSKRNKEWGATETPVARFRSCFWVFSTAASSLHFPPRVASARLSVSSLLPRVIVAVASRLTSASESTQAKLRTALNSIIAAQSLHPYSAGVRGGKFTLWETEFI